MAIDYDAVAADLRAKAAEYLALAESIERVSPAAHQGRTKSAGKAIKAASGTGAVVLSAIRDGAETVTAIASSAKLKEFTARSAILALEKSGKVKREGKGRSTRYVAA
jgi:predicted Rossmann fold nucleotide-binding protein DprA/Smf involved in DNA uptake